MAVESVTASIVMLLPMLLSELMIAVNPPTKPFDPASVSSYDNVLDGDEVASSLLLSSCCENSDVEEDTVKDDGASVRYLFRHDLVAVLLLSLFALPSTFRKMWLFFILVFEKLGLY